MSSIDAEQLTSASRATCDLTKGARLQDNAFKEKKIAPCMPMLAGPTEGKPGSITSEAELRVKTSNKETMSGCRCSLIYPKG